VRLFFEARAISIAAAGALSLVLGLAGVAQTANASQQQAQAEELRVVLVGNSLSAGLKRGLSRMFKGLAVDARLKDARKNGATLGEHSTRARTARILSQGWDFVVLQENSLGAADYNPGAPGPAEYPCVPGGQTDVTDLNDNDIQNDGYRGFCRLAQQTPTSEHILLMTWQGGVGSKKEGIPDYEVLRSGVKNCSNELWCFTADDSCDTQTQTCSGYVPIAKDPYLNARIAPVGEVFKTLGNPAVFYRRDGKHLVTTGRWVAAVTLLYTITREFDADIWRPRRISEEDAALYTTTIWNVITADQDAWNNPIP
jgi:hypothetical protein